MIGLLLQEIPSDKDVQLALIQVMGEL